jgi:uncharacterized protein
MTDELRLQRLVAALDAHPALAIAVSGGVDSMVLAHVAHRHARVDALVVHARSPAVPAAATARVQRHARRHGWALRVIEPAELEDPAYRSNPVDRCFHCKKRLYGHMHALLDRRIASGTNTDDLTDYRPGLQAARDHDVCHPYVDAGLAKDDVYALARTLGLDDLAVLPAQPCLASRIETGIAVDAVTLGFIETVEEELAGSLAEARAIRCRVTAAGVVVECDVLPDGERRRALEQRVAALCVDSGRRYAGLRPYRRGAAFLRSESA